MEKTIRFRLAVFLSKTLILLMRLTGRNATSLPGSVAYAICNNIPDLMTCGQNVTLVTGTNGKTTTARMIARVYWKMGYKVVSNSSGANLISGIVTSLTEHYPFSRNEGVKLRIVLEIDEAVFGRYCEKLNPKYVVVTNLFRDQLDRYGELSGTRDRIKEGLVKIPDSTVFLCADDSLTASLGKHIKGFLYTFGIDRVSMKESENFDVEDPEAANCIFCGSKYKYSRRVYGHLGEYACPGCRFERPVPDISAEYFLEKNNHYKTIFKISNEKLCKSRSLKCKAQTVLPVPGEHNVYNALACVAVCAADKIFPEDCINAFGGMKPGFGRGETFLTDGKKVCVMLTKNPAGARQALNCLSNAEDTGAVLFLLNDKTADGKDVSWIWDVDFESNSLPDRIFVSGTRCYDMALRIKYSSVEKLDIKVNENIRKAFGEALEACPPGKTLYVFPNYTSLLSLRAFLEKKYKLGGIRQ